MFEKKKLQIELHIEGKKIEHFLSFELNQRFNAHHSFELRIEHGKLGLPGLINLENNRDYVGRTLSISFGNDQSQMQNFAGMITQVSLSQSHGYQGVIVLKGYSPTILIDRGPDLGSYTGKTLKEIIKLATAEVPENDLNISIQPARKQSIDYIIQYKESDFNFLNRLSAEYLEWFYYDGEKLNFGKPSELVTCKLTYGREIRMLEYGIKVNPVNHRKFSYLPHSNQLAEFTSEVKTVNLPDLNFAIQRSKQTFSKVFNQPIDVRVDNENELKEIVNLQEQANVGRLLAVTAQSDSPLIRIGGIVEVETSVRQDLAFVTDGLGQFLVTDVNHYFDDLGRYSNSFNGIVSSTERIFVEDYERPLPEMQIADVIENEDPKGLGRIRVKFQWKCGTNDTTEWLRVLTPNAGTGERGSNRGFFSIPEIGDQVIVSFEEGNVARPIVMGSMYHQSNMDNSAYANNHLKSITTRTGHLIEFDDRSQTQGIKITDIRGNFVHIDTNGNNITITSLENMTLNCKNMQINVGENMDIQVGENQSIVVGNDQSTNIGNDSRVNIGNDYSIAAMGNIVEQSDNRTEVVEQDFARNSSTSNEIASEISAFSTAENMTLQSGKIVEINSAEKSKIF